MALIGEHPNISKPNKITHLEKGGAQSHTTPRNPAQHRAIPRNPAQPRAIPRNPAQPCAQPCATLQNPRNPTQPSWVCGKMYGCHYAFCSGRPYVVCPDSETGVTRIQVASVSGDTCFRYHRKLKAPRNAFPNALYSHIAVCRPVISFPGPQRAIGVLG